VLATLPEASVHMCVTSPPYYALRSYLHVAHPDKPRELGSEATPEAYLAAMVEVFRAVRRVLRDDGTCWVNQGDLFVNKQLQLMPARFALALQADGWFIRSSIIWHKPNPMPESCTDRPTSAHEHVFLLSKRARYYYDADAVREANTEATADRYAVGYNASWKRAQLASVADERTEGFAGTPDAARGRNLRNVWTIPTQAFPGVHYATYPTTLVERCIRAGTSERGCCAACGAPWVRQVERELHRPPAGGTPGRKGLEGAWLPLPRIVDTTTTGWAASCQCNDAVVPCTVLDPFVGSGTTALVADRLQRHAIGIDLSIDYAAMAQRRLKDDCPLFTSWAPAETDAQDERMRDLFSVAAD